MKRSKSATKIVPASTLRQTAKKLVKWFRNLNGKVLVLRVNLTVLHKDPENFRNLLSRVLGGTAKQGKRQTFQTVSIER